MSEGTPLHGDRAVWNATAFPDEHAIGIRDSALQYHLPLPGAVGGLGRSDGTDWQWIDGDAYYVTRAHWLQNGFIDATEVSLAWADGGPTLTVDAVGASFSYLHDGLLYTKTGPQTKTIDGTEGIWIFYFDGATLTAANAPNHAKYTDVWLNETVVAILYWDATNSDGRLMYELHGAIMTPESHHRWHDSIGSVYGTGMALADFVIDDDGDDAEDAQFSMAAGVFADEDIEHSLATIAKATGAEIWYLDGANWRWTTSAGYSILTLGAGRMAWNNGGAQAEVGNNDFALCHIFATTIGDDAGENPKFIAVQAQATYATKKLAWAGAETEINALAYGTLPLQEIIPVGTVIFQTSNGYGNAVKSRTVTTEAGDDYVDWRSSNLKASGGSIAAHNSIPGLQGGTAGEYYHLTDAQHTAIGTVDVSAHGARHDVGGGDSLSNVPDHDHTGDAGDGGIVVAAPSDHGHTGAENDGGLPTAIIHEHVVNEDQSAACDGVKVNFITANEFVPETTQVFLEGVIQRPGPGLDYAEDDGYNSFEFLAAPNALDVLLISYIAA